MTVTLAMLLALAAPDPVRHGPLTLDAAIVHAAPAAGDAVAGYVAIANSGAADRLTAVACACAGRVEIHLIDRAKRRMDSLPALDVPANGKVEIRPGSDLHLMLIDAKAPLAAGASVPVTLTFSRAGAVTLPFTVVDDTKAAWAAAVSAPPR